jgi:molybdopterin molybdotransferase
MNKLEQFPVNYKEASKLVLLEAEKVTLETESISLANSIGRVLASSIRADSDKPLCSKSSMDGFCIKSSDIETATLHQPVCLPTVKGIDAGSKLKYLPGGHCAYIATGAQLPENADSVIKIEDTGANYNAEKVCFKIPCDPGNFVRQKGSEQKKGDIIIPKNTLINPFILALAGSTGLVSLKVKRKPVVGILTSGDELVMPWEIPSSEQKRNVNSIMLCNQVEEAGATAIDFGIARDNPGHAESLFLQAVENSDMVVTSGGISMGRRDPFRNLFARLAIAPIIYGVDIQPGKPFFFGWFNKKPVFGLPGNQVSSAVTFELFVRSFIRKVLGLNPFRQTLPLELTHTSFNHSGRDFFQRGNLLRKGMKLLVCPVSKQDSHMLSGLATADLLYLHPADRPELPEGSIVESILLKNESNNEF